MIDTRLCVKNTIKLRSGRYFDFRDPQPDQFTLEDIAGALSKICRFGGHCNRFYSVAEHLVHCHSQAEADGADLGTRAAVFMHDATEAFCGDMVRSLKIMIPDYQDVEERIERVVSLKFSLNFEDHYDYIKEIDNAMLIAERDELFSEDDVEWTGEDKVRLIKAYIKCWTPAKAESKFMAIARKIGISE